MVLENRDTGVDVMNDQKCRLWVMIDVKGSAKVGFNGFLGVAGRMVVYTRGLESYIGCDDGIGKDGGW